MIFADIKKIAVFLQREQHLQRLRKGEAPSHHGQAARTLLGTVYLKLPTPDSHPYLCHHHLASHFASCLFL